MPAAMNAGLADGLAIYQLGIFSNYRWVMLPVLPGGSCARSQKVLPRKPNLGCWKSQKGSYLPCFGRRRAGNSSSIIT